MVDVEALKAKLKEKQEGDNIDLSANEEPAEESDPRKWGKYIILGITAALVIFFIGSYIVFKDDLNTEPPQACLKDGRCIGLEIAFTPEQLELGLSGRESLPADKAMLFVFSEVGVQRMWMKDMKFPIDILWLADNGKILHIEKRAVPCDPEDTMCEVFEPNVNAKYVLEAKEDFANDHNLYDGIKFELKNLPV